MKYPLTALQQGMLIGSLGPGLQDLYMVQTVFEWRETIQIPAFERAWNELASRHEILRSTFFWRDTREPYQQAASKTTCRVAVHSPAAQGSEAKAAALQNFLEQDLHHGFSLSEAPPWRVSALRFADGGTLAVWTFHHILLDGRSHVLLIRELLAIYDALLLGTAGGQPVEEIPQGVHAEWLARQDFSPLQPFWTAYLDPQKVSTAIPLPVEEARNAPGHSSHDSWLGSDLTQRMRTFARAEGVSAGIILQTAWALLLGWLAGETDVTFGAIRACRKSGLPDGGRVIGMVINTLPLRVKWNADSPLRAILQNVARDWHQFRDYEHTPPREICKWLGLPASRELFRSAVSFSSDYLPRAVHSENPIRKQRELWVRQTVPYCAVDGGFDGDDFHLTLSTPNALVESSLAGRLPAYLRNALEAIVGEPDRRAGDLCLLPTHERNQLIHTFNPEAPAMASSVDWLEALTEQARQHGERIAVHDGAHLLTWRQLEERSNQVARCLHGRGASPDDVVAVFLPRSAEFLCVCLGIMKAGAAYLPLDTKWPELRLANVLRDAAVRHLISRTEWINQIPAPFTVEALTEAEVDTHSREPLPPSAASPDRLAYVIYTSGSSGLPKGVEITQAGLQNLIDDMRQKYALSAADRASFLSNTAFDASVHEVWPALSAGASIHIAHQDIRADPKALLDWLRHERITFAFLSTIMAEGVLKLTGNASDLALRIVLTGGDQLRQVPDRETGFQLVNEYGPTECTVVATRHHVVPRIDAHRNIPIGKPIRGTRAYVVNRLLQPLPCGVPGELLLAGPGLARGYRRQPEMTAAKFVSVDWVGKIAGTLYRTGDLVRWLPEGDLQYFGRIDSQVKLRGFRIELGEIEACLLQHPLVSEAAVVLDKSAAQPRLVAVVVPHCPAPDAGLAKTLAAHLRKLLPEYMIPAGFVWRTDMPLNSSGKYDRQALASLPLIAANAEEARNEPVSEAESQMLQIWEEVLGMAQVKISDRFLELGATSLSIIQMICALEKQFGKTVSAAELMADPNPADLLRLLEGEARPGSPFLVPLKSGGWKSPLFIIPGAGGGVHWFRDLAATIDAERPVMGLELLSLSEAVQSNFTVGGAAEELSRGMPELPPDQPYWLSGYSGGGLIALEVAAQLQRRGKRVDAVILIETYPAENLSAGPAKLLNWARGWLALPPRKRWQILADRMRWYASENPLFEARDSVSRELNAMKDRHIQAFIASPIPSYRGKIVIVSAEERPLSVAPNPWSEWERILATKFDVVRMPGDHYTLLMSPNAQLLGQCLSRMADEFERNDVAPAKVGKNP